jgi:hypothetical protein
VLANGRAAVFLVTFSWCQRCGLSRAAPCSSCQSRRERQEVDAYGHISKVSRPPLCSFKMSTILAARSDAGITESFGALSHAVYQSHLLHGESVTTLPRNFVTSSCVPDLVFLEIRLWQWGGPIERRSRMSELI